MILASAILSQYTRVTDDRRRWRELRNGTSTSSSDGSFVDVSGSVEVLVAVASKLRTGDDVPGGWFRSASKWSCQRDNVCSVELHGDPSALLMVGGIWEAPGPASCLIALNTGFRSARSFLFFAAALCSKTVTASDKSTTACGAGFLFQWPRWLHLWSPCGRNCRMRPHPLVLS